MDLRKFEVAIRKTGFHLEQQVASLLRAAGWSVISNKYYVDDQEDAVREIDLVAYRVKKVQDLRVVTTLIISCKKSEKNVWALLARNRDRKDPNADWWPVHVWSNERAISFAQNQPKWREQYHLRVRNLGVARALAEPEIDIFAYQEMNRDSGSPQNDKPIFASVTSLMKAQSYELDALPQRRKTPAVYQFNLLTVVDADLVRLHFDGSKVVGSPVTDEQYVARYIIKKKEMFARIHFINIHEFPQVLEDYGRLHAANGTIFPEDKESFYRDILTDNNRVSVFAEDFSRAVLWMLSLRLRQHARGHADLDSVSLSWNEKHGRVDICVALSDDDIAFLSGDAKAREVVTRALKKVYRYEGPSDFAWELPF
jgi:hypothetical protein